MLEDPVRLAKEHEPSVFSRFQRDRPIADVGHLQAGVAGQRFDLCGGDGEDRSGLEWSLQLGRVVYFHGNAHRRGKQSAQSCQCQPAALGSRCLSHIEGIDGVLAPSAGQAQDLVRGCLTAEA